MISSGPVALLVDAPEKQVQGWICGPEVTGPPIGWLRMVRRAPSPPGTRATTVFAPLRNPVSMPSKRPVGRTAKRPVTPLPFRLTRTRDARVPFGYFTATRASPPETASARLDRTSIETFACAGAAAHAAISAVRPSHSPHEPHGEEGTY